MRAALILIKGGVKPPFLFEFFKLALAILKIIIELCWALVGAALEVMVDVSAERVSWIFFFAEEAFGNIPQESPGRADITA
ncbi:MAG: hypothetical protein Aseana_01060 [Candidatus Pelagadaptatus aseana]|uniref:hypothetical protein n=1 Tax=Candidatus Pelagadaptatus aseana TaxID=3120508 RepID=UPI0039B36101